MHVTGGYDVMLKSCTVASMAMRIFRHMFLTEDHVPIVPEYKKFLIYYTKLIIRYGYERNDRASDIAIKYMEWREKTDKVHIQHAGNGREKHIYKWKVDGYIESKRHAIEFLGKRANNKK